MNAGIRVVLACVAIVACDVEHAEEIDLRDASAGWRAVNHALAPAYAEFAATVQLEQFGEVELACTGGGTVTLVGRMSERRDFQLDAMLDACSEAGVVLDGNLTVTASLELFFEQGAASYDHDDIRALVIVDYHGMMELDGTACSIAAQVHANGLVFAGFASDAIVVDGELCELDANAVVRAA